MLDLANFITSNKPKNGRFFTIAIDGRGGSGKSSLVEHLKPLLPGFTFLNGDDYFEPIEDKIVWGAFNDERFIADIVEPLKTGDNFTYRPYDWHATPPITEQTITVQRGLCLERVFSFRFDLDWDLKIWVETPKDICLARGTARDKALGERAPAAWHLWQAEEDEYIKIFRPQERADIVLDGTRTFGEQII